MIPGTGSTPDHVLRAAIAAFATAISSAGDDLFDVLSVEDLDEDARPAIATVARSLSSCAASLAALTTSVTVDEIATPQAAEPLKEDHVDYLRIPVRLYNALYRADLHYVPDVRALTDAELLALRGIGAQSLTAIRWALEDHEWRWWDHEVAVRGRIVGPARALRLRRWWEEVA
jgi:hypothetical protein